MVEKHLNLSLFDYDVDTIMFNDRFLYGPRCMLCTESVFQENSVLSTFQRQFFFLMTDS